MAHHQDGSSVQKHSAGTHYPFVVGVQEFTVGPATPTGYAYVQDPSGLEHGCYFYEIEDKNARLDAYAKAFVLADRLARALREAQAWAAAEQVAKQVVDEVLAAECAKVAEAVDKANAEAKASTGWRAQVMAGGDAGLADFE